MLPSRGRLFFLVFTVLRTAVNSDFVYSIPRGCHGHPAVTCSVSGRLRIQRLSVSTVDTWIVERMTKDTTASAPSTMKIMVVGCSTGWKHLHCWLQMLRLRGSVVPAKFSASGIRETLFQSNIKCDARNDGDSSIHDEDQFGCSTGWKYLHCWRQTVPLRGSVADRGVCRPSWIVDRKGSVEESPVLRQCKSVPICVVATLMSLATAGRGPLLIASVWWVIPPPHIFVDL